MYLTAEPLVKKPSLEEMESYL